MGFFDRFKPKHGQEAKKPRHVVSEKDAKSAAEAAKKKLFQAVPSAEVAKPDRAQAASSEASKTETGDRAKAPAGKSVKLKGDTGLAHRILIKPITTEKSSRLGSDNQYVFSVHPDASKQSVRQAVQAVYGVRPSRVNTSRVIGRSVRYGRAVGRTKAWKKAVVRLPEGKSIDIYGT